MADKVGKRKAKAKRGKSSVLENLPATRPQRLGRPRADAPPLAAEIAEPPPRPKRESPRRPPAGPARVEATPVSRRASAAKPPAAPSTRAAKPAAATSPAPPRRAAKPAAAKAAPPARTAKPAPAKPARSRTRSGAAGHDAPQRRPAAVRPGARPLEGQRRVGDPPPVRTVDPPRGTELVTTTIQAVGELAQIGFTVGGRALKRAVDRLPKP
jgi:hypothetical protein